MTYGNGDVKYYTYDEIAQDDICAVADKNGNTVATYVYDAWGNILASTDTSTIGIGAKNPLRYRRY